MTYARNQWSRAVRYVDCGLLTPDNNTAENAIRPVALGRKNWLFAGVPKGADASAMLFSLVETAKANEIEPQAYLKFLFERFPQHGPRKTCGRSCRSTWTNPFSQAFPSPSLAKSKTSAHITHHRHVPGRCGCLSAYILFAPLFFGLGAVLGAVAGAYGGCLAVELLWKKREKGVAHQAAVGAMFGKILGLSLKMGVGVLLMVQVFTAIWKG